MPLTTSEYDILIEIKGDLGYIKGVVKGLDTRMDDTLIQCAVCRRDIDTLKQHRAKVVAFAGLAVLISTIAAGFAAGGM